MFRRYNILIEVREDALEKANGVLSTFGCSISEPSNWVAYELTEGRGLTFLDDNGKELESPVFQHQPLFNAGKERPGSEAGEVRELVMALLTAHCRLEPNEVQVIVSEYNRL